MLCAGLGIGRVGVRFQVMGATNTGWGGTADYGLRGWREREMEWRISGSEISNFRVGAPEGGDLMEGHEVRAVSVCQVLVGQGLCDKVNPCDVQTILPCSQS